jgi:uncharacterized membrane protein (UPF0182 family)
MRPPSDLPRVPRSPGGGFRPRASRRGRLIGAGLLAAIVAVFVSARSVSNFYVDLLWFDVLGRTDVFWGVLGAKVLMAGGFTAVAAAILWVNLWVVDRAAPAVARSAGPERTTLGAYRALVARRAWLVRLVISLVIGAMIGLPASGQWADWLRFRGAAEVGVSDPLFGRDVGFYMFRLPFLQFVAGWCFATLVLVGLVVAGFHYLAGGIRARVQGQRVTPTAKAHLSVIFALVSVARAGGYWLERFDLTRSTRGVVQGATFTDVNAQLPATNLMILVSLAVAVLFLANVRQRGWRLPVLATVLWILLTSVAGTIYPALVQRFSVQPNVSTKELPYIARNIEATRAAMGLDAIVRTPVDFADLDAADVASDPAPLADVRQLDPIQMRDRFALDEGRASYFAIRDLDVDRYEIDGREQQVLLAARELNTAGIPNSTWVSRHLLYTHGCGIVAAPASRVTSDGRPVYVDLGVERPELYFGEGIDAYAIVKSLQDEQPCDASRDGELQGEAGVRLSSVVRRAAYALHLNELNLLVSGLVTSDSEVLLVRNVRERAEKAVPFLRFDGDPYPVVVDGRVTWLLDAFTTSDRYPYAQRANNSQLSAATGLALDFNYVRNSVKVAVDAYDGSVTLYAVDDTDPVLATWRSVFPRLFTPVSEAPPALVAHFRYPEDLFRVQTNIYGRYQFDDATLFFNRDAAWSVAQAPAIEPEGAAAVLAPVDPLTADSLNQGEVREASVVRFEPYFTMFHSPGDASSEGTFSMLRPFVPFSADDARKELRAFAVVSSDPDSYGRITIFEMADPLPEGPATVAAELGSNAAIAQQITLLDQRGSRVIFGDLQIVPIARGFVYVRPLFVRPDDPTARQVFVRKMLAAYADRLVMADDLDSAIAALFRAGGTPAATTGSTGSGATTGSTGGDATGGASDATTIMGTPAELLARAEALFAEADAALATTPPDFALYQRRLSEARELVRRATELLGG